MPNATPPSPVSSEERDPPVPAPAPESPQSATATAPRPARPRLDQLPPYRVLLHNDDVNAMDAVVESILGLTPLTFEAAVQAMLEAHKTGVSLLLVTHQERAELYREQFQSKKITVTIEPAE